MILKFYVGVDKYENDTLEYPVYNDINLIKENPDIIIDFSIPEASLNILEYAKQKNIPIVIATTGFSDEQLSLIKDCSKHIPIFMSGNMSYEINLMADLVSNLAVKIKDSDIEIIETYHRNKIDSPSGTALILADSINNALNNEMNYQYNRQSIKQKRSDNEIGIHSIRGGTEVGKHTVLFLGENETFGIYGNYFTDYKLVPMNENELNMERSNLDNNYKPKRLIKLPDGKIDYEK